MNDCSDGNDIVMLSPHERREDLRGSPLTFIADLAVASISVSLTRKIGTSSKLEQVPNWNKFQIGTSSKLEQVPNWNKFQIGTSSKLEQVPIQPTRFTTDFSVSAD